MSLGSRAFDKALEIFTRQLDCVVRDERAAQLELYTDDLRYEFPFANDRPRLIHGREAFRTVMEPIWERRRRNNIRLVLENHEFHATEERGLFLAVFTLAAVFANGDAPISSPCVQLIRFRDERIAEVREYFEP